MITIQDLNIIEASLSYRAAKDVERDLKRLSKKEYRKVNKIRKKLKRKKALKVIQDFRRNRMERHLHKAKTYQYQRFRVSKDLKKMERK